MDKNTVLAILENNKKERSMNHLSLVAIHGYARGLSVKEYNKVLVKSKGSGTKGKGFANNRLWDHNNEP